jgi:4-hydroxy-3-methylbut-2-enyl diphosphate reductase
MKIIIPKHSGFCYGVKRSVDAAYTHAQKGNMYMYGEVVHNPDVIRNLQTVGFTLVHDLAEIPTDAPEDTWVFIRAHGVPLSVYGAIAEKGFNVIDMTCSHVTKIHAIVANAAECGMDIILCGVPDHPEVRGTLSRVTTQAVLVQHVEEAKRLIPSLVFSKKGVCLVAQTTYNHQAYKTLCEYLTNECENIPFLETHDTICQATAHRQNELHELAKTADACIIVGGKNSSNVRELYETAKKYCSRTQHIEHVGELNLDLINGAETVVVAGGASTPEESVKEVERMLC